MFQVSPSIPLSDLIDFVVNRIYHDLTVCAELMAKKNDVDRKMSIVNFVYSSRVMLLQLLAVVKWLKAARKVTICEVGFEWFSW